MVIRMIVFSFLIAFNGPAGEFESGLSDYREILREYVDERGDVDYEALAQDTILPRVVSSIAGWDLSAASEAESLAFYINAYNALVLHQVVDNRPLDSPMSLEGFFRENKFTVAGEELTLDRLEHRRIIPINDTLVHFGLVCAAHSCPPLRREIYRPADVTAQLQTNARTFMRDTTLNYLNREAGVLYLSRIFDWFGGSFISAYGSLEAAAAAFMGPEDRSFIENNEIRIEFLEYNWQLNTQSKQEKDD